MKYLIYIIIMFTGLTAHCQLNHYTFTNYNTANGLPDNLIQSITQDHRGFLWVGTKEGLSRFDGKTFNNFFADKNDSIITCNDFKNITEYKEGCLVMNNCGQIICFNTYTEKFYKPPFTLKGFSTLYQATNQLGYYISNQNKAYITNGQLQIIDSIITFPNTVINGTLQLFYFKSDVVLILYGQQYYWYHFKTKKYEALNIQFNLTKASQVPYFRYYDSIKNCLYFSEYFNGIFEYNITTNKTAHLISATNKLPYVNSFVNQIIEKQHNEWWFLCEKGISILNKITNTVSYLTTQKNASNALADNNCITSYTDKDGNFWIGTVMGLSKLNTNAAAIKSWTNEFDNSTENGLMSIVKGADNNMYVSAYQYKSFKVNTITNKVTPLNHPLNVGNWNLFVNGNNVIRTGTGNVLLSYNVTSNTFTPLHYLKPYYQNIELIVLGFLHSNGDEWYCANNNGGFVRKLANTNFFVPYKNVDGVHAFSNPYYTTYTETTNKDIWLGSYTSSKLLHWRFKDALFTEKELPLLKQKGINAITHDHFDNIWIASNGAGLLKYNTKTATSKVYSIADGLPSNFIVGLQFDNNNRLWLTTAKGLSCFIINENRFLNFKKEDGIADDNFTDAATYFDTTNNQMWLGANKALMNFDPNELINLSKNTFNIYVDKMYLNGKMYDDVYKNNIQLSAFENNLQFHFVGVDLNKGKTIEYNYWLEGADKNWVNAFSSQTATYANLRPGTYTFKVRAKHMGDNKWSEVAAPLFIKIATPWFLTWWFFILIAIAVIGLMFYINRLYFLRKMEIQKAIIDKQQALENERSRIASDMHDDLGSGLTKITYLSQMAMQKQNAQQDLLSIKKTSTALVENMSEIIWAMKEDNNSLEDLLYYIKSYTLMYCSENYLQATIHFPETFLNKMIIGKVRRNIYLAVKEALHNIVKHAHAKNVTVKATVENQLIIVIKDDGVGIQLQNLPKNQLGGNGLKNIHKRIHDSGGNVSIQQVDGTEIIFTIPLS